MFLNNQLNLRIQSCWVSLPKQRKQKSLPLSRTISIYVNISISFASPNPLTHSTPSLSLISHGDALHGSSQAQHDNRRPQQRSGPGGGQPGLAFHPQAFLRPPAPPTNLHQSRPRLEALLLPAQPDRLQRRAQPRPGLTLRASRPSRLPEVRPHHQAVPARFRWRRRQLAHSLYDSALSEWVSVTAEKSLKYSFS